MGSISEIKFNTDGVIKIRHSDIDPQHWGELHEHSKRLRQPKPNAKAKEIASAMGVDLDSAQAKELIGKMGGYIVIGGESKIISAEEVTLIHEAVKRAGGVIPNWSNRP